MGAIHIQSRTHFRYWKVVIVYQKPKNLKTPAIPINAKMTSTIKALPICLSVIHPIISFSRG